MEPRDLVKVWAAPDHSKLTPKQWSVRLPIQVAARINALCELYPRKTKTEIIGDLLATAIEQLAAALPAQAAGGDLRGRFDALTRRYLAELDNDQDLT